jgi:hypothetical protein
MAVRSSALRWLLAVSVAILLLYTLLCMGFYLVGARHLPDRLEPARWQATPEVRAQLLQVEAGMAPADTVPRLDPLTFVPRVVLEIRSQRPGTAETGGHRLLINAARMLYFGRGMHAKTHSHHLPEIALRIRLSREWTTEQIADTLLAESHYGRCSVGIDQAAYACFGRPLAQLRRQETLALIALLKGPSWYSLDRTPERFRRRYADVAERLGLHGPDWSADAALARLIAPACTGTHARSLGGPGVRAATPHVR